MMRARGGATLVALALVGCDTAPTAPPAQVPDGSLTLEVSGGLGGAGYAFALTPEGALVGVSCTHLCDFEPGDTLLVLTPAQRAAAEAQVAASGIAEEGPDVEPGLAVRAQGSFGGVSTGERVEERAQRSIPVSRDGRAGTIPG